MSNGSDPFHGNVTYLNRRDLETDNDPLTSMDGMLLDIATNCKVSDRYRHFLLYDSKFQESNIAIFYYIIKIFATFLIHSNQKFFINKGGDTSIF